MNEESPQKIAINISQLLNIIKGKEHFPIDVADLALSYSQSISLYPEDSIIAIKGADLSDNFDGILQKTQYGWVIIYNSTIKYSGRINFTLAHEFGHYLLHRKKYPNGMQCTKDDLYKDNAKKMIETEANIFASFLLMPLDDFRKTEKKYKFSPDLFQNLSSRYNTSLTATVLKWIDMTDKKAMIVLSDNGFIKWKKQSSSLYKTGLVSAKKMCNPEEIPSNSVTYKLFNGISDADYEKNQYGIWCKDKVTTEEVSFVSPQLEFAISIVLFHDDNHCEEDDSFEYDCYDKISASYNN